MSPEKMVYMINQIATFFRSQPGGDQAAKVAAHIRDFWEPRMRQALQEHLAQGGDGLAPLAADAARLLRDGALSQ